MMNLIYIYITKMIQVVPGRAGDGSFGGKRATNQRKNLPIECAQGDQPVRCPNRVFCGTSLQPFHGGDVMC